MRRRFRDASPEEINALTLDGMRDAVMAQLHAGNLEVRWARHTRQALVISQVCAHHSCRGSPLHMTKRHMRRGCTHGCRASNNPSA